MSSTAQGKLYRLRIGEKVYENLTAGAIIKNIRGGKLRPSHLIAPAGSEKWTPLGRVPQLAGFFSETGAPDKSASTPATPGAARLPAAGSPSRPTLSEPGSAGTPSLRLKHPDGEEQHQASASEQKEKRLSLADTPSLSLKMPQESVPGGCHGASLSEEMPGPTGPKKPGFASVAPLSLKHDAGHQAAETPATPQRGAGGKTLFYDIRRGSETNSGVPRKDLAQMIRDGDLKETDRVSPHGADQWSMAGDMKELQSFFNLLRKETASRGFGGKPKDKGAPFYADIAGPFLYIGNKRFLINMAAILFFLAIAILVPIPIVRGPIQIITNCYLFAYYFRVVSNTSSGSREFPEFADMADFTNDIVNPAWQYGLTRLLALAPLMGYVLFVRMSNVDFLFKMFLVPVILTMPWLILVTPVPKAEAFEIPQITLPQQPSIEMSGLAGPAMLKVQDYQVPDDFQMPDPGSPQLDFNIFEFFDFLYTDPLVWLGLAIWLVYVPIALMRIAAYGHMFPPLNIVAIVSSIGRAFGPYLALIGLMLVVDFFSVSMMIVVTLWMGMAAFGTMLGAAPMGAPVAGAAMQTLAIPFMLLLVAINIFGNFIQMFFIGRFVFQYSDKMGWD